jgi:hypothetical protein
MNQKEIAKLHQRDLNRYLKFANREFYKALKNQVEPILTDINQQVTEEPLRQAYLKVYEKIGVDSAKKEYFRIKKQEGLKVDLLLQLLFNTWASWMRDYVQAELGFLITQVTQNTQNKINQALQDSLEAGDTREQTAKRIYKYTLGEIGLTRARLIARTESTRANNVGKRRSADDWQQLNPQNPMYKKWIHVPQKQNRDFHVLEGSKPPIPIDESFEVYDPQSETNTIMEQPGDVSAPASQTCNCGCTCVYLSERVARRNFKF